MIPIVMPHADWNYICMLLEQTRGQSAPEILAQIRDQLDQGEK